jgi:hypothetical protein
MGFVKSASTSTPVSNSKVALEKLLMRYGATGFGVLNDYERQRVVVTFRVPDAPTKDAPQIPIRLELDIRAVYDALYGRPTKRRWDLKAGKNIDEFDPAGYDANRLKQADRVAWRQLILWVDAACSAAAAGVQKMSEAFFAHTVIRGDDGVQRRLVDHLEQITGGEWRALLGPGKGE